MNKIIYSICLIVATSACTVEVSTESELELLNQTVDQFNTAFEACDIATLDRLTTSQYTHSNGSNAAISKDDWMAYLKKRRGQLDNGQLQVTKYLFEERQVRLYKNSAFVTGVILLDGVVDSTAFSRKIRVSHFWVKDKSQWKRAGFHDTRVE